MNSQMVVNSGSAVYVNNPVSAPRLYNNIYMDNNVDDILKYYGGDINTNTKWYFGDCEMHAGLHSCDDLFLVEIRDPRTHEPVAEGERGEIVVTNLFAKVKNIHQNKVLMNLLMTFGMVLMLN